MKELCHSVQEDTQGHATAASSRPDRSSSSARRESRAALKDRLKQLQRLKGRIVGNQEAREGACPGVELKLQASSSNPVPGAAADHTSSVHRGILKHSAGKLARRSHEHGARALARITFDTQRRKSTTRPLDGIQLQRTYFLHPMTPLVLVCISVTVATMARMTAAVDEPKLHGDVMPTSADLVTA